MHRALAIALALAGCAPPDAGLLGGRPPTEVRGVQGAERLTDGWAAQEGAAWNGRRAARLSCRGGRATWDLGAERRVAAAWLQADNNDDYVLLGSTDGKRWTPIWRAPRRGRSGLRGRGTRELDARARRLRLVARGGDGACSVAELAVFEEPPPRWPPRVRRVPRGLPDGPEGPALALWTLLASAWALGHRAGRRAWTALGALVAALTGVLAVLLARAPAPVQGDVVALRAAVALVAAAAVARLEARRPWLRPERASRRALLALLAAAAVGAVACFWNLGRPQFTDARTGEPTWVHAWDLRVYQPTVRYFRELGYDGLYLASAAAWLEETGTPLERVADRRIRDLDDYGMARLGERAEAMAEVRARFSPERWAAFRADVAWFSAAMGSGWLRSMVDHGANATPVWMLGAWPLLGPWPASDALFRALVLVDPLLLLLLLVVAWRTFGPVPALAAAVVFGATPLPWFNSTWAGAPLRHDWLVTFGLGLCALRARRPALGGALLAWSALVRVFPALGLAFLAVPALLGGREARRLALRAAAGAAAWGAVLVVASALVFGPGAWSAWADKIGHHAERFNVNHVGLPMVVSWDADEQGRLVVDRDLDDPWDPWREARERALARRRPLFLALAAALTLLGVAAARRGPLDRAALVGLSLVPAWLAPSNYYLHFVLLWPLAGGAGPPLVALGTSAVQSLAFRHGWADVRYTEMSADLLVGLVLLLTLLARRSPEESR